MKYIRNDDGFIAFLDDNLHEITDEDLPISDDFYFKFIGQTSDNSLVSVNC